MASYASKGSLISLDGEIRTRRYEKNGVMQYVARGPLPKFSVAREPGNQRAMRKMVEQEIWPILSLEEEDLPF